MNGRILVVEDDSAIAMAVRDRLESEGHSVECAADGIEGFKRAVGAEWDLIILDVMLPGNDGLEICRDIRGKTIDTPILMLTARDETVDIHISSLRRKLGDSKRQEHIITVRGQGYKLRE